MALPNALIIQFSIISEQSGVETFEITPMTNANILLSTVGNSDDRDSINRDSVR